MGAACPKQIVFINLGDNTLFCELKSSREKSSLYYFLEGHKKLLPYLNSCRAGSLKNEHIVFSEILQLSTCTYKPPLFHDYPVA